MALHCIWTTNNAKDAILKAVNLRGDADSVESVTGQLAGSAYGVSSFPKEWVESVRQWDGDDIALRAYRLFHGYFFEKKH
jgi:ADP-ribosylglycohydrolase